MKPSELRTLATELDADIRQESTQAAVHLERLKLRAQRHSAVLIPAAGALSGAVLASFRPTKTISVLLRGASLSWSMLRALV